VDDAKVHPGQPVRIQVVVLLDGDSGGDRQPQPPPIGWQGDRANLLGRVRQGAGQPHPEFGLTLGNRQPYPLALDGEGAMVVADRDQGALAPREPGVLLASLAAGGGVNQASL
jgi:hypothetical protein